MPQPDTKDSAPAAPTWVANLFWIAAAYDGVLGLAFLLAGPSLFSFLGVNPPNHWAYVHFAAALLVVFAVLFARLAADPIARCELILYGVLLKVAYASVVFGHAILDTIPGVWVVFAMLDTLFAAAFIAARRAVTPSSACTRSP